MTASVQIQVVVASRKKALRKVLDSTRAGEPDLASVGASLQAYNAMMEALEAVSQLNREGAQKAGVQAEQQAERAVLKIGRAHV